MEPGPHLRGPALLGSLRPHGAWPRWRAVAPLRRRGPRASPVGGARGGLWGAVPQGSALPGAAATGGVAEPQGEPERGAGGDPAAHLRELEKERSLTALGQSQSLTHQRAGVKSFPGPSKRGSFACLQLLFCSSRLF